MVSLGFGVYLARGLGTGVVSVDTVFIFGSVSDWSCWDFSVDGGCTLSCCSIPIIANWISTISASSSFMASRVADCAAGPL